ncbi:MAG: UTP--glucose-1-phosphate uridylyltransferase [Marine Group III euryarchaeote CG-Bathy1]|uniref:UTP--glucose-1-phosphate uridylyltransferase n=1 Tax=Marine Group III euryarchaeote CG-Bathy1 TaxID=1889001 RepID=A0A1J5TSC7_9ARCH|nr:MAG: UTP--glucose-1-phosphate uridylyltransferase [Marine Group III euryarchaeote CG-Bathy1]
MASNIKAVIPAAGLGTRFLPLTKAQPKEMLPVVDKPTIQWVVEEAINANITDIAIITGKHKAAIENHFNPSPDLEDSLKRRGKEEDLAKVKQVSNLANITFIRQESQKGLGDAILCAKDFVGDDPFAVLLGDTICVGNPNCTKGLVDIFNNHHQPVFAVEKIAMEDTRRYGVMSGDKIEDSLFNVDSLVEKPEPSDAPSNLGVLGRYIFTPDIFNYQSQVNAGVGGEIQLTDAMNMTAQNNSLLAWKFSGTRFDIGTMEDWFRSHLILSHQYKWGKVIKDISEDF